MVETGAGRAARRELREGPVCRRPATACAGRRVGGRRSRVARRARGTRSRQRSRSSPSTTSPARSAAPCSRSTSRWARSSRGSRRAWGPWHAGGGCRGVRARASCALLETERLSPPTRRSPRRSRTTGSARPGSSVSSGRTAPRRRIPAPVQPLGRAPHRSGLRGAGQHPRGGGRRSRDGTGVRRGDGHARASASSSALEAGQAAGGDSRGPAVRSRRRRASRRGAETREGIDRICDLRVDDHPEPIAELRRLLGIHLRWDALRRANAHYAPGRYAYGVAILSAASERFPDDRADPLRPRLLRVPRRSRGRRAGARAAGAGARPLTAVGDRRRRRLRHAGGRSGLRRARRGDGLDDLGLQAMRVIGDPDQRVEHALAAQAPGHLPFRHEGAEDEANPEARR